MDKLPFEILPITQEDIKKAQESSSENTARFIGNLFVLFAERHNQVVTFVNGLLKFMEDEEKKDEHNT